MQAGDVEEILQAKTRELLELKKRKLELELEATKKSLEEQDKQLSKVTNGLMPTEPGTTMGGTRMPGVSAPIMPTGIMAPGLMSQHHMHPRATHPVIVGGGAVPPTALFHTNFNQTRPQQQPQHVPVGMMSMPPQVKKKPTNMCLYFMYFHMIILNPFVCRIFRLQMLATNQKCILLIQHY